MTGLIVSEVTTPDALKVTIDDKLYFFVIRRKQDGRFSLVVPVESAGMNAVPSTLVRLQPFLKTYGLLLSPEAVIMEENIKIPLHERIGNMVRALIGMDAIRRLWQVEADRRPHAESEDSQSVGDSADDRTPR